MESMAVVCGMTIVLIGMLPVLEIFIRLLKKTLNIIGRKIGLDAVSTSGKLCIRDRNNCSRFVSSVQACNRKLLSRDIQNLL